MSTQPNWCCPSCGYVMFFELTHAPVEVSILTFCPSCHVGMDRLDVLGHLERDLRGSEEPVGFEDVFGGAW